MPRRIIFRGGAWWLADGRWNRLIRLEPEIERCGWNVARLGRNLGIGTRTFSRLIEESLGITSKRWLREQRIVKARHMLREEGKISVVALTLGFRHASDFAQEFRKLVGVSPSEYARSERSRSTIPETTFPPTDEDHSGQTKGRLD